MSLRKLFKIKIHKKATKEIMRLPRNIRRRILDAIRDMKRDPFSEDVKPIKGLPRSIKKKSWRLPRCLLNRF